MLIDWFTVVAQLVNFVILLAALKYLLFDRILQAMEQRRRGFADRQEEAERLRAEAEEEAAKVKADRAEIEANWEEIIDEARREAADRRKELLEDARGEVETRQRQWLESLHDRQDRLVAELQRETGMQAAAITRRALGDLAGEPLEAAIVRTFVDRLTGTVSDDGSDVVEALRAEPGRPIAVRTSFHLSDDLRDRVRQVLRDISDDPSREIEWIQHEELIAGIEVTAGPRTIGWTIDTYLDELRARFTDVVRHEMEGVGEFVTRSDERDGGAGT